MRTRIDLEREWSLIVDAHRNINAPAAAVLVRDGGRLGAADNEVVTGLNWLRIHGTRALTRVMFCRRHPGRFSGLLIKVSVSLGERKEDPATDILPIIIALYGYAELLANLRGSQHAGIAVKPHNRIEAIRRSYAPDVFDGTSILVVRESNDLCLSRVRLAPSTPAQPRCSDRDRLRRSGIKIMRGA